MPRIVYLGLFLLVAAVPIMFFAALSSPGNPNPAHPSNGGYYRSGHYYGGYYHRRGPTFLFFHSSGSGRSSSGRGFSSGGFKSGGFHAGK